VCLRKITLTYCLKDEPSSKLAQSLGETIVSFDFGPAIVNPRNDTDSETNLVKEENVLWPIYILRGNGDILLVYNNHANFHTSMLIFGPLTMRPPAEDNYGVDACSLICLDCVPPVLVVATSSGVLYHCISLVCDEESSQEFSSFPIPTLYVYESLELTISLTSIKDQEILCPIRLHKSIYNPQVYFCSHIAGVHVVNVPLLSKFNLKDFSLEDTEPSIIENLICTKPLSLAQSSSIPLGLGLIMSRFYFSLIVLLSSGDFLVQRLSSLNFEKIELIEDNNDSKTSPPAVGFSAYISQILKRTMNAPLLKSEANKEPIKEESFQLLLNTTELLRQEYLLKMETAAEIMSKRIKSLINSKNMQMEEIEKCFLQKSTVLDNISAISKKYDTCLENQEKLSSRIEQVLRYLQNCQNHLSESELMVKQSLYDLQESLKTYKDTFSQIQLKFDYQQEIGLNETINSRVKGAPVANQIKAIRRILNNQ